MKKYSIIILLLWVSVFSVCAADRKDTLYIDGDWAFPPYEFINTQGKPDGLNVDLIKEVMKRMNIPYIIRLHNWTTVLSSFQKGETDLILGMNFSNERMRTYRFGAVHEYVYQDAVCRKGETPFHTASQLKDKSIVVQYKAITKDLLHKAGFHGNKVSFCENMSDGILGVLQGKYDVAVCDHNVAAHIIRENKYDNLLTVSLDIPPQEFCFVGHSQKILDAVGTAFYSMKKDGTYDKLHDKWIPKEKNFFSLKTILSIIGIVFLISCILLTFIIVLKLKVRAARRELSIKNTRLLMALKAGDLVAWRYDVRTKTFFRLDGEKKSESGFTYEVYVGRIHPDDRQIFEETLAKSCQGNIHSESLCVRVDREGKGLYRNISKEFGVTYATDGSIESVVGTDKDITETVLMQKKLQDSIGKMSLAIKYANVVFWEYETSKGYYRFYSTPLGSYEDTNKVKPSEIMEKIHPEDRKKMAEFLEAVTHGKEKIIYTDVRIMSSDIKGWRCIRPIATAFNKDEHTGKVLLYVGFTCDYTGIYELNKEVNDYARKMDLLIKSSKVKLWSYDRETHKIELRKDDEILIRTSDEIIALGRNDKRIKQIFAQMEKGELEAFTTHGNYVKDGKTYYTQNDIIPLRDEDGNIKEYFGSLRDITDFIEIQKKLEEEKEKAQQSDKLKTSFITNMNHEIRTPLNGIIGFSQILAESCTELSLSERRDFARRILTCNNNLLSIISNIIEVSQMESDSLNLSWNKCSVNRLCMETIKTMEHLAEKGVDMTFVPHEQDYELTTDCHRVMQLLSNYLSNAAKFTAKGTISLDYRIEEDKKQIVFSVMDTGIGVPMDKGEIIFERFEKLDRFETGTGLGLYICRILADAFHGKVMLDTSYSGGARFLFIHPIES